MMPKYIEQETVIERLTNLMQLQAPTAREIIEAIPAADVRPVVLCRNCKYCIKEDEFEYWCNGFCSTARLVREDDYCSHGAEREEGENGPGGADHR